jgi:hypothetical protein
MPASADALEFAVLQHPGLACSSTEGRRPRREERAPVELEPADLPCERTGKRPVPKSSLSIPPAGSAAQFASRGLVLAPAQIVDRADDQLLSRPDSPVTNTVESVFAMTTRQDAEDRGLADDLAERGFRRTSS